MKFSVRATAACRWRRTSRWTAILLGITSAGVVGLATMTAQADTVPPNPPGLPATVSADALPTVQMNGVVWSQATAGNTVYAVGQFTKARPAGSAAGVNEVSRSNLLAYDITTGNLISSFNHFVNATAFVATTSPDGSILYIGGDFTSVDSNPRNHIAAFSTATGALLPFAPSVNARVKAIAATNTTVYYGGQFTSVNGVTRTRLAAASTAGALLSWAPTADDNDVSAMVMAPTNNRVIIGGKFSTLNHASARGSGSVDAVTGATAPWAANTLVQNYSSNDGITSLRTDGTQIYATGFVFGGTGNLEGTFAADPQTGAVHWLEDCHGDTYDALPVGQVVYTVSHSHYCGNIGAFQEKGTFYRATAFTTFPTGTVGHNAENSPLVHYHDWGGQPSPTQLDWYPTLTTGTFTGQNQGAWSLTGNSQYIALGGEFPTVNGSAQNGLVRFAVKASAPNTNGPRPGSQLIPTLTSLSSGTVRVAWAATFDQDNESLTYKLVRDGRTTAPILTTTVNSTLYREPPIGFTDTGLVPGSTHTYRVYAYDPFGNANSGSTVSITLPTSYPSPSSYAGTVLSDGPSSYWRLGEPAGPTAYDAVGSNDLIESASVGHGAVGALTGDPNTASTFNGSAISTGQVQAPDTLSIEAWFRTSSKNGGLIAGLGDSTTTNAYLADRILYLDNAGHVHFGVTTPTVVKTAIASTAAFNNGAWHHVVAELSTAGMALYVDGAQAASNAAVTSGLSYVGRWNLAGFPSLTGWPGAPTSSYLASTLDEVAVYPTALTPARVLAHFKAGKSAIPAPNAVIAAPACTNLSCTFDGSGSSDPNPGASIVNYAWNFGDGTQGTGATVAHSYAAAGNYTVTLSVTSSTGAGASTSVHVAVTSPAGGVLASDLFNRTLAGGWGTADQGGAWGSVGSAANLSVSPGAGALKLPAAGTQIAAFLGGVSSASSESDATVAIDKSVSAGAYADIVGRRVSAGMEYRGKVKFVGSKVVVSMTSLVGSTETAIGTSVTLAPTYPVGTQLSVRFQVFGTAPTTLAIKVWAPAVQAEPAGWTIAATDSNAALQAAGATGITAFLSGAAPASVLPVTIKASAYQVLSLP